MPRPPFVSTPKLPPAIILVALLALLAVPVPTRADELAEVRGLVGKGDLNAALQRADKAVAAQPRDVPLRFLRGVVLMDLARDDEALAVFTQLSQDHPDLPDPYNNIGLLQARAGRLDLALQALQAALRTDPSHRTARANLGQVHVMLAVSTWEALVRTGPVDAALLRRLEAARALLATPSPTSR